TGKTPVLQCRPRPLSAVTRREPTRDFSFKSHSGNIQLYVLAFLSAFIAGCPQVNKCSGKAECSGTEKIRGRTARPKLGADNCTGANNQVAELIIGTDHLTAALRIAVSDDQRLARGITKFFQSTDKKGNQ